jgi:hypothetical protein
LYDNPAILARVNVPGCTVGDRSSSHMETGQIVCLGLSLICGAGVVFVLTWIILAFVKPRTFVGVERTWFSCVSAAFYVGLAILLSSAIAPLVRDIVKAAKGTQ